MLAKRTASSCHIFTFCTDYNTFQLQNKHFSKAYYLTKLIRLQFARLFHKIVNIFM